MVGSVILIIIWAIILVLNIILFFKIWGMTNDVSNIKDILLHSLASNNNTNENIKNTSEANTSEFLSVEAQEKIKEDDAMTGYIVAFIFGIGLLSLLGGFFLFNF